MRRFVCLFLLFLCSSVNAQKKLDGIYMGFPVYKDVPGLFSREDYIAISGNEFTYMIPQYHFPIRYNDTLAECEFKWIGKEFIELNNSKSLVEEMGAKTKILQIYDSVRSMDSITIQFVIKHIEGFSINIHTEKSGSPYVMEYYDKSNTITLPRNIEKFCFDIEITELFNDLLCHSLQRYESPVYAVNKDVNFIRVEMQMPLEDYFEKFYVDKEYARVRGNEILWKGRTYKKANFKAKRILKRYEYKLD